MSEIDAWDAVQPGCCSRVPGSSAATTCEAGDDTSEVAFFEGTGDVPVNETPVQYKQIFGGSVWLQVRTQESVELGVIRTSIPPPENIIDLSPVYWIGSKGTWPDELHVGLPADSGASIGTVEPDVRRVQVYYSADGVDYVGLTTDNLLTPAMAFILAPGFVVAGAGPNTITCQ